MDRWLASHAQADVSRRGTLIGTPGAPHNTSGVWLTQMGYRDSQGAQWMAMYTAVPKPDGGVQGGAIVTNLPVSVAVDYVRTAGGIVGSLSRADQSPTMTRAGDERTAAVLHEGRGESTVTGFQFIESTDLLLTDGWAYLGLTIPPEYLDEAASKQREPSKWHRWKSSGNTILVETGGQWTKLVADRVRPLPAGAAMNISLIHRQSTSFGGMGSFNTVQTITLQSNGRYERSAGTIAGTGAMQAAGGFSGGAGSFQDQHQRSSSAGGGNGTVTTTTRSRGAGDPNLAGTYTVVGYTLEFHGAGGAVQRVLAFYPFSDNNSVYIDGVTYSRNQP